MSDVWNFSPAAEAPPRDGQEGIGGWLILPVIGLVGTLFVGLMEVPSHFALLDHFAVLNRPQKLFIAFEVGANLLITVVVPILMLMLVVQKRRAFPKTYTIWGICNLVFAFGDLALAKMVFPQISGADLFDGETLGNIARAMLVVGIWVVYMNVSKRVKNTFVN